MDNNNDPIQISKMLEDQLILTNLEEEEKYILTPEEEKKAIDHAIKRKKEHIEWKMKDKGLHEETIQIKISQIVWEKEINEKEILCFANSCKQYGLWEKQQRENEIIEKLGKIQKLKSEWTSQRIYLLMKFTSEKEFDKKLIVNENNKHLITTICFFLSNDERFESELKYSFKKGLMIRGISGLGKTFLLRCVEKNELNPILILSMIDITDDIKSNGEYKIISGDYKKVYLDDVGTEEPTILHYGTRINFFKNFIEQFYLRNKVYEKLIISTNNSFDQIENKYGFRVRSRMKDMFNVVNVTGEDMRGK